MDDSNSHWPKGPDAADAQAGSPDEAGARLAAIRHEIDAVDQNLLALFNERAALSLDVSRAVLYRLRCRANENSSVGGDLSCLLPY